MNDDTTVMPSVDTTEPSSGDGDDRGGHDGGTPGPGWLRRASAWWAVPGAIVLVVILVLGWLFVSRADAALPGVSVEGIDVGGMNAAEIDEELSAVVAARRDAAITAAAGDETFTFELGEQGYRADVDEAIDEALSAGRDGPLGSIAGHVRASFGHSWELSMTGQTVADAVDGFVQQVADTVDREPFPGSVQIDPETAEVTSEPPADGAALERDQARDILLDVAGIGEPAEVTLPVDVLPAATDPTDIEAAVAVATAALSEPYVLAADDGAITIEPTETADYLVVEQADGTFTVSMDEQALRAGLEGRGEGLGVEPVSADFRVVSGYRTYDDKGSGTWDPTPAEVEVIEGRNGTAYDVDLATEQVLDLFEAGQHQAELELVVAEADLTNDEAVALKPDALLGTFTTYDACCGNRQHNIQLLADLVDGATLLPGENYSVNDRIGRRTLEKGFLPAGAIDDGRILDDDVGGGISQFATTFYNAAFFAGIEVLEHRPHTLPISRYPLGREATFNYAIDLDINILNNTEGALIVKTSHTDQSVSVYIIGKDDGRTVTAEMGEPHDYTDWEVRREPTDELAEGQERFVQSGAQGFTVDYRRIIEGGSTPGTEDYSWSYLPKPEIIEYGTGGS